MSPHASCHQMAYYSIYLHNPVCGWLESDNHLRMALRLGKRLKPKLPFNILLCSNTETFLLNSTVVGQNSFRVWFLLYICYLSYPFLVVIIITVNCYTA